MTIEEFVQKYGTEGAELLIGEFIFRSPDFPGDKEIATMIGTMMGDLRSVLVSSADPLCALIGGEAIRLAQQAKSTLQADASKFGRWDYTPRILRRQVWTHKDGQPERLALRGEYRSPRT